MKRLYLSGIGVSEISKTVRSCKKTISKIVEEYKHSMEKFTVMREDGLKFKTLTEASVYSKSSIGDISRSCSMGYKCKGYKWYKINEFINNESVN